MARSKVGTRSSKSGGDPNILKLEDQNRVRLIDTDQVEWRQHVIEDLTDPDQVTFLTCPGPAKCPLCRKPSTMQENPETKVMERVRLWPASRRFATNVWDYGKGEIKVLVAGPTVFDEFATARDVGFDPLEHDWIINKVGQRRQTKYKVVRGEKSTFSEEVTPDDLHDLDKYDAPSSQEIIFETIEKAGYDYDAIEAPTFTEAEALEFVMPFGQKHKGETVEQIIANDPDYMLYLHGEKLKDGAIGDDVFVAFHTALRARNMVPSLDEVADAEPAAASEPAPADAEPEPASNTVKLRSPEGEVSDFPESAAGALMAAGFEQVEQEPAASEANEPLEISDDTPVHVTVGGIEISMEFKVAREVVSQGSARFVDDRVLALAEGMGASEAQAEATAPVEPDDPDKPFRCDTCGKQYKAKGGLTAHVNKEHGGVQEPAKAEPAAATNGAGEDRDKVLERVKDILAKQPGLTQDYQQLLALFDEVAGKRNITEFTVEELIKLEEKLNT